MTKYHYKFFCALVCALSAAVAATRSGAQTSAAVDRAQLTQTQTQPPLGPATTQEGVEGGQIAASPNDADLGEQQILKRVEEYQPFTASVGTPLFYTSNVALTSSGERSDLVVAPAAAVYYEPQITNTLYGRVDVRQQFFYYQKFDGFDFGSMDVEAGLSYFLPQFHNLILRGEYDFNRLTFSDSLDDFFENHSIILNAELPFRFSRAQRLSLGVDANISVAADHQSPRRNDYDVYAGYSVYLTRAFYVDSVGRVVVRDYHQNNRTDVSEILSVTANYRLTKWWTVSAISSFAHNDSNHDVFDYNVVDVGGAIALTAKF